jgi:hypothetical protein
MQNEHSSQTNQPRRNLDERLSAYYGPTLSEHPLPASSWSQLSSHLAPQHHQRSIRIIRLRRRHHIKMRDSHNSPSYIQAAFSRIAYEAGFPFVLYMLACTFDRRVRLPTLRVSLLSKRHVRLRLPLDAVESMVPSALDVLLATGLSRYVHIRKPSYLIPRLLLIVSIVAMWAAFIAFFVLWPRSVSAILLPIALGLCIILTGLFVWTLHMQKRRMGLHADNLLVLWLGRSQACQGLHALADLSPMPTRRTWGEPSLAERINHVCGTHVPMLDERLTLVR